MMTNVFLGGIGYRETDRRNHLAFGFTFLYHGTPLHDYSKLLYFYSAFAARNGGMSFISTVNIKRILLP